MIAAIYDDIIILCINGDFTYMNILDLVPGISKILDKFITSPTERAEIEAKLKELDIRELEAKAQVQASWLSNKSLFVSGAIPSILWMMVIVIFFNFILAPIIQTFGYTVPILDLPAWYAELCSTIVLGLFAKKAWDATDMSMGSMAKKSKYESEAETTYNMTMKPVTPEQTVSTPLKSNVTTSTVKKEKTHKTTTETTTTKKPTETPTSTPTTPPVSPTPMVVPITTSTTTNTKVDEVKSDKPNYDDPEYINARLNQMYADMEAKKKD